MRIDPGYLEAINSLGFAQEALGNNDAAVQTYGKAIALNGERHGKFVAAEGRRTAGTT